MKKREKVVKWIMVFILVIGIIWIIKILFNRFYDGMIFDFKQDSMEIKINESFSINYELNDKLEIKWESGNSEVAIVNNGIVTGVSLGNTLIKGTVVKNGKTITRSCYISTYYGEKEELIKDIIIPDGEIFITKGDSYELDYKIDPIDAYIKSIDYKSSNENIVSFTDSLIVAKNKGTAQITITINNALSKIITVNVIDKNITPTFSNKIKNVNIENDEIIIKPNESQKIIYTIVPDDGFIEDITWTSSDSSIASVEDDIITGKASGEAIIKMVINGEIEKEIKVMVSIPVSSIKLKSNSKIVLRQGQQERIITEIIPSNATNKKVSYSSSSGSVNVDSNGIVTGISQGTGKITVKSLEGNFSVNVPFTVNPVKGIVNGTGGVWAYESDHDQVPIRAEIEFFRGLASKGKGTLSGTVYTYTDSARTYKYNLGNSILNTSGNNILMRIYYPQGVDLSEVNTFTFFGGGGERNLSGYFDHLDKNRQELKSSGIIILISARSSYGEKDGIYATDFVKSIIDQKSGVKNAVGGYSMSGEAAGYAANNSYYDRLIIFDSYFKATKTTNLKNKEVIIYSPVNDAMLSQTLQTLNEMMNYTYNNVTIVSNNSQIVNKYSSKYLVINPGSPMGKGHGYVNITNGKVFSYACR